MNLEMDAPSVPDDLAVFYSTSYIPPPLLTNNEKLLDMRLVG